MHGSATRPVRSGAVQPSDRGTRRPLAYWRDAAHFAKRVVWARTRRHLVHRDYLLAYEARHVREESDYAQLHALAEGRSCILDVGANVGATTLVMADAAGAGTRIVAFDASEASCAIIRENARLNGLDGAISVVNAVVGRQSGRVTSFFSQTDSPRGSVVAPPPGGADELVKPTLALDDFLRQTGLAPDLIKIDVEGAECDVLVGLSETLRSRRPVVFVELHAWPSVSIVDNAADMMGIVGGLGYRVVRADVNAEVHSASDFADLAERVPTSVQARVHVTLRPDLDRNRLAPPAPAGDSDTHR